MDLNILIIVFGFLMIAVFIINGFYRGRQNRSTLERDQRTENLAQELSPTTNEVTEKIGSVDIIEFKLAEAVVPQVEVPVEDAPKALAQVEQASTTENEVEEYSAQQKASLWGRLKHVFGKKKTADDENSNLDEPQSQYFVSLKAPDGQAYAAADVDELCRTYMFQLRDMNIYYHENEGRTVFGICGNTEPYGFADVDLDKIHYPILNIFMDLPERGFAESNYVEMVSFAYIITQKLGGQMVNENSEPIDEQVVNRVRDVLAEYDRLA